MTKSATLTLEGLTDLVAKAQKRRAHDAQYAAFLEAYRTSKLKDFDAMIKLSETMSALTGPLEKAIVAEMAQRLAKASAAGMLRPVVPADAPTIFHDSWNSLLEAGLAPPPEAGWASLPDCRIDDISKCLANCLINAVVFPETQAPDADTAKTLLDHLEAGSLPQIQGSDDILLNFADGRRVHIVMENWTPELFTLTQEGERRDLRQMPYDTVFHVEIDFPTGRLLVSDTVNVGDVVNTLTQIRSVLGANINYAEHRIRRTAMTALVGVVDIAIGSDGPGMVRDPKTGRIIAGNRSDAFPGIASICHDYWGTTIVDREAVMQMTVSKGDDTPTREEVDAQIDDWLSESPFHNEITVAPGVWHLYWDDDRESVQKIFAGAGHSLPDNARFVLSPTPIELPADKLRTLGQAKKTAA